MHHALCNVIEPIFERSFIFDSYANRVGKGTHRALDRAQHFARRYRYVLQIDLEQFFPAIDHAILRRMLQRQIKDARTLWLIDQILASGAGVLAEEYAMRYFPRDNLLAAQRPRGLPDRQSHFTVLGQLLSESLRSFCAARTALPRLCALCG